MRQAGGLQNDDRDLFSGVVSCRVLVVDKFYWVHFTRTFFSFMILTHRAFLILLYHVHTYRHSFACLYMGTAKSE